MSKIIAGSAARLEFAIVDGTTGAAITDAVAADISTAKYQTIGPSGQRSALSADVGTLTTVASTASVIAGSFGAIDATQGLYFIDFPALAALDSAHSVIAVIELVSGDNVALPVVHEIDAKVSTRATPANVTDAKDAILTQGNSAWVTATGYSTHSAADVWTAANRTVQLADAAHGGSSATLLLGAITITTTGNAANITLAGSGSGDGIEWARSGSGDPLAEDVITQIQSGLATSTCDDRLGYVLAALAGACADAGTAAETYEITIGADTFTIDHTGLDATGNRGTAVLTKS
jgi:hypothetical protein